MPVTARYVAISKHVLPASSVEYDDRRIEGLNPLQGAPSISLEVP